MKKLFNFISLFSISEPSIFDLEKLANRERENIELSCERLDLANKKFFIPDSGKIILGTGQEIFKTAVESIYDLKMFDIPKKGFAIAFDKEIKKNTIVVVKATALGLWVKLASVVSDEIYSENENFVTKGFSYTTLNGHIEFGKEWFLIEYNKATEEVFFILSSISRPNFLGYLIFPIIRYYQKVFQKKLLSTLKEEVTHKLNSSLK